MCNVPVRLWPPRFITSPPALLALLDGLLSDWSVFPRKVAVMVRGTRPRHKRVEVWLTEQEHQMVTERAASCGLSGSGYLRNVGLGYTPKGMFDHDAVLALIKVHADQGRLGGLLKLWLTDRSGEGAPVHEVRGLLREIEALQTQLRALVAGVKKP